MRTRIVIGILILFIGLWIWFTKLGIPFINFSRDWPIILIILGLWILYRGLRRKKSRVTKILEGVDKGRYTVDEAVKKIKEG